MVNPGNIPKGNALSERWMVWVEKYFHFYLESVKFDFVFMCPHICNIYVRTYVCMYVCMYVRMYTYYVCVCMYVCMYVRFKKV